MSPFLKMIETKNAIPKLLLYEEFRRKRVKHYKDADFMNFKVKMNPSLTNRAFPTFEKIRILERAYLRMMEKKFGVKVQMRPTSRADYEDMRGGVKSMSKKCIFIGAGEHHGIEGVHGVHIKSGKVKFTPLKRTGVEPFQVTLKDLTQKK